MVSFFQYNNNPVAYTDSGSGQVVLLLHGFGENGNIWNSQVEFLKQYCRLIVPDLPGSGQSPLIEPLTIDLMAEIVFSLIRSVTNEPFIVLGHSMGGYITLALTEKYAESLKGFGLIHSTAFADTEEKKNIRRKSIAFINEHNAFTFLQTAIPNLFGEKFKRENENEINLLIAVGKSFSKEALIAYYEAMICRPDRTNVLKGSKVPVLFVLGTEDQAISINDMLKQVSMPAISYFHILEKTGHMGMLEMAEQVNTIILNFMQDFD